jgi:hypothetical protein
MSDAMLPSHARDEQVLAMCVGLLELHAAITQSPTPAAALRQALLDKGIDQYESVTANLSEHGYVYVDPATGRFRPGSRLLDLLHMLQEPAIGEGDAPIHKAQGSTTDRAMGQV